MQEINKSTRRTREKIGQSQLYKGYNEMPPINRKVYNFMIESGLTQKEFADRIGMTQQNIGRLFKVYSGTGQYPKITKNIREGMIKAFGLSDEWFIEDENVKVEDAPVGIDNKSKLARFNYITDYLIRSGRITAISALPEVVNVSRNYISMVMAGKIELGLDFLNELNKAVDYIFNVNWMLTGEGDMLAKKDDREEIIKKLMEENAALKAKLQEAAMEIINLNSEIRSLKK
jgi:transcriptional regulator with XRE-family HTH domain